MNVNSSPENWVIITCTGVQIVAAASDIPGLEGVCMLCDCLRKAEVFKAAALGFSKAS